MNVNELEHALESHFRARGHVGTALEIQTKKSVVYCCAARHGDKVPLIAQLTGYENQYVFDRIQWLKDNDQLITNTVTRSALLAYIPHGDAIIDAWLNMTPAPAPAPKPKVVANGTTKAATIRAVIEALGAGGARFEQRQILEKLAAQGVQNGGGNVDQELYRLMRAGLVQRIQRGNRGTSAVYQMVTPPARLEVPAPPPSPVELTYKDASLAPPYSTDIINPTTGEVRATVVPPVASPIKETAPPDPLHDTIDLVRQHLREEIQGVQLRLAQLRSTDELLVRLQTLAGSTA